MSNLFGRRYMRGEPRRTERLVGAFVLFILAVIVGLFALTGGLFANVVKRVPLLSKAKNVIGISETPLFVADPKNAKPRAPSHAVVEAMSLLPELKDVSGEPFVRAVAVERVDGVPTATDGSTIQYPELNEFDAIHAYSATYQLGKSTNIHAAVLDMGQPESAFGVWTSRRPASSKTIPLGRGGWIDEASHRIAFWNGRYFTELVDTEPSKQPADDKLKTVASGLASIQITYGGPFWAESVLPREGQTERSFRYVKKNGFGVDSLSDVWLADYANGLTIGVIQPASPEKVLASLKQRAASQPATPSTAPSEALASSAVAFKSGDRETTAFDAGPYVFLISSQAAQKPLVADTAKMLHDRWSGASAIDQVGGAGGDGIAQAAGRKPQATPAGPTGAAKFAEVDGLVAPTKIERYTDNLYEKIDGREPMFRSFNFAELRFGQYLDERTKQSYDIYLYDMTEPNNTMGIYMKERSGAGAPAGVGRDSYVSGTNVYFWKGKYYVNILGPAEGGEAALAGGKKIAAAIAETIADTGSGFWAEDVLPKENRVPESFKYQASGALSYDFLKRVYRADYKSGDKTYSLFAKKSPDARAAHELFMKLADASKKYGDVIEQRIDTPGSELLVSRSIDVFMVVVSKGVFVGGVSDCDDKELALKQAQVLRERMPADAPGEPEPASEPAKDSANGGDEHGH